MVYGCHNCLLGGDDKHGFSPLICVLCDVFQTRNLRIPFIPSQWSPLYVFRPVEERAYEGRPGLSSEV